MFIRKRYNNLLRRQRYTYDILEIIENGNFKYVGTGITNRICALEWDFIRLVAKNKGFIYQLRNNLGGYVNEEELESID